MLKKILFLGLVLLLPLLTLTSCGQSPTQITTAFLDSLKAQDFDTAAALYDGDLSVFDIKKSTGFRSVSNSSEVENKFLNMFYDFKYSIEKETIRDKKATVLVSIQTYKFGNAIQTSVQMYFKEMLPSIFLKDSKEVASKMENILTENIENAPFEYESTVSIALSKGKKGWRVDEISENSKFMNALSGGLVKLGEDYNNLL